MSSQVEALRLSVTEGKLSEADARFASDLIASFDRRGSLSDRQFPWVAKLLRRAAGEPSAMPLAASVASVFALFGRAKAAGLKYPKIRLAVDDGLVVLAQCGERSKYNGDVQLTDGGRFGSNRYFGRIDKNGNLIDGRDMSPQVRQLVTELAANPEKVASIHGHQTGECCFCGLALTDGRSVAVGYGPVCAENFGLAWGAVKVDTAVSIAA